MVVLGYGHVEFSNLYSECNGRNVHCGKSAPLGTARVMTPKIGAVFHAPYFLLRARQAT